MNEDNNANNSAAAGDEHARKTISLPAALYEEAAQRAQEQGRNFSNYVQQLIRADLAQGELAFN